ncbi:MAG: response regulator transcription factor [Candidatus Eremiobacteraeota bacterium]|nr:response regulator transcription factor [Candidatus Eremiobacteraeota bacterium]
MDPANSDAVERALQLLTDQQIESHPVLVVADAERYARRGNMLLFRSRMLRALETSNGHLRASTAMRLGGEEINAGNSSSALKVTALGLTALDEEDVVTRAGLLAVRAVAFHQGGSQELARQAIDEATFVVAHCGESEVSVRVWQMAGLIAFYSGNSAEANLNALRAVRLLSVGGVHPHASRVYFLLYALAFTEWKPEVAIVHAERAYDAAISAADLAFALMCLEAQLGIVADSGDVRSVAVIESRLRDAEQKAHHYVPYGEFIRGLARAQVLASDCRYVEARHTLGACNASLMRRSEHVERDAWLALFTLFSGNDVETLSLSQRALASSLSSDIQDITNLTDVNNIERAHLVLAVVLIKLHKRRELSAVLEVLAKTNYEPLRKAVANLVDLSQSRTTLCADIKPGILAILCERLFEGAERAALTTAELRVLRLLADGMTSKEAAARLGRSPKTIDNQVESILAKLGAQNRTQAVSIARRTGVLAESP